MSKKWIFHVLVMVGLVFSPAASQAKTIFAVVGGMSGPLEQIGTWFKNGALGAVEEINSSGGLLGDQVEFIDELRRHVDRVARAGEGYERLHRGLGIIRHRRDIEPVFDGLVGH